LDVRQIDTSSEYVHIFLFFKHIQVLHVLVLVENNITISRKERQPGNLTSPVLSTPGNLQ
ncbi:TPA: hypothetical protein ACJI1D_004273, partial [Salmonella enterica subsp. enterica serovar Infantis]